MKIKNNQHDIIQFLTVIFSVVFMFVVSYVIAKTVTFRDANIGKDILAPYYINNISPEPLERLLFIVNLLLVIPVTIFFYYIGTSLISKFKNLKTIDIVISYSSFIIVIILTVFVFIQPSMKHNDPMVFLRFNYFFQRPLISIVLFSFVCSLIYLEIKFNYKKTFFLVGVGISVLVIFLVGLASIFSLNSHRIYELHFFAVFYPMVQVYLGKMIFFDFANQYGLYPHLLLPIFKLFKLSVLKFTILMSVLNAVSFVIFLQIINLLSKSKILMFFGFFSVLFFNYICFRVFTKNGIYFHLYPIRFYIFPTITILLFILYIIKQNKCLYYSIFFVIGVAILWNRETGIILYITYLSVLSFKELFDRKLLIIVKNILIHFLLGTTIVVLILFLYCLIMYIFYSKWPDLMQAFEYQKQYLQLGFGNLPMRLIHPWNLIILLYIIGISYSVQSLFSLKSKEEALIYLFLSIYGLGIFSYYNARTADNGLFNVTYPAILIMIMIANKILIYLKYNFKDRSIVYYSKLLLFLFLMYIMASSFFSTISNHSTITNYIKKELITNKETGIVKELEMIKEVISKYSTNNEILILSFRSHIFHLITNTTCPIKIPSFVELHLRSDYDKVIEFINKTDKNKKNIVLDEKYFRDEYIKSLLKKQYVLIDNILNVKIYKQNDYH